DDSLAFLTVLFALNLETQSPQRHWAVEVVVPGHPLSAVNDVVNRLAREFSAVPLANLRQVSGTIARLFVGIGPVAFRAGPVTSRAIVLVFLRSGRFGGENTRGY